MTLHQEFPQHDSLITELKTTDNHFRKLFDEFESLNHKIHGLEFTGVFEDDELNSFRMKRVHLKDQLFSILESKSQVGQ